MDAPFAGTVSETDHDRECLPDRQWTAGTAGNHADARARDSRYHLSVPLRVTDLHHR